MIRWTKISAGSYRAIDTDNTVVAEAHNTSTTGGDSYPWSWHLIGKPVPGQRATGSAETLRDAKDSVLVALGRKPFYCASSVCPGYPYKASDMAHPLSTCGADAERRAHGDDSRRIEIHAGPDDHGRYRYTLYWTADYHPGHPDGENRTAERGQVFFDDYRRHSVPRAQIKGLRSDPYKPTFKEWRQEDAKADAEAEARADAILDRRRNREAL